MTIASDSPITKDKILSLAHANVYNLVNNRSNVSDPSYPSDSGTTRSRDNFVHVRMPDIGSPNFRGYPFIIVHPATVSFSKYSLEGTKSKAKWGVIIEVQSSDRRNVGVGAGQGMPHMDSISDSLIQLFNSQSTQNHFQDLNMFNSQADVNSVEVTNFAGERLFRREFIVKFENLFGTG